MVFKVWRNFIILIIVVNGHSVTIQGSAKLRENLKPNEKPVEVKEETQQNIRQVKTVAGILTAGARTCRNTDPGDATLLTVSYTGGSAVLQG